MNHYPDGHNVGPGFVEDAQERSERKSREAIERQIERKTQALSWLDKGYWLDNAQFQLAQFYAVHTKDALIEAQAKHIEKLQAARKLLRDEAARTLLCDANDLAMMVRCLARALKNIGSANELADEALTLLDRKCLPGKPLRDGKS